MAIYLFFFFYFIDIFVATAELNYARNLSMSIWTFSRQFIFANFSLHKNKSAYSKKLSNQRTSGPVNAHLISWPSKAQNIQNLKSVW